MLLKLLFSWLHLYETDVSQPLPHHQRYFWYYWLLILALAFSYLNIVACGKSSHDNSSGIILLEIIHSENEQSNPLEFKIWKYSHFMKQSRRKHNKVNKRTWLTCPLTSYKVTTERNKESLFLVFWFSQST